MTNRQWMLVLTVICAVAFALGCVWARLATKQPAPSNPVSPVTAIASPPSPSLIPAHLMAIHVDRAPRIGQITVGAFAPAALPGVDLSITGLDSDTAYAAYRQSVQSTYGANLADMNYLGVGTKGWQERYQAFHDWLLRASPSGDPTIALEPLGPSAYGAFMDDAEMRALRDVFTDADHAGIVVWVRFASESNLRFSVYSVYNDNAKIAAYRHAVRWFRSYMPKNVRLVFSPLINTIYLQNPFQLHTIDAMYEPGVYDRIGGTLYATSWLNPRLAFDWYYKYMRAKDTETPFQICELGGIYPRSDSLKAFLVRVARGDWPGVERVNLFAGDLNTLAVSQHGHFGFVLPGETTSYLSDLFGPGGHAVFKRLADDREIAKLEELGAGWRSPGMMLEGTVTRRPDVAGSLEMRVDSVTDESGQRVVLSPAHLKDVIADPDGIGSETLDFVRQGDPIRAIGQDDGIGTPLHAGEIIVDGGSQAASLAVQPLARHARHHRRVRVARR